MFTDRAPIQYGIVGVANARTYDWRRLLIPAPTIGADGPVVVAPAGPTGLPGPQISPDPTTVPGFPELAGQAFPADEALRFGDLAEAEATTDRAVEAALSFLSAQSIQPSDKYSRTSVKAALDMFLGSIRALEARKAEVSKALRASENMGASGDFSALRTIWTPRTSDEENPFPITRDRVFR